MDTNKSAIPAVIRTAREEDCPFFSAIYAPYAVDTLLTFETEAPDDAEFRRRLHGVLPTYPFLTAVCDGDVVGYAYAHRFRERAAYYIAVECSIYLRQDCGGRGVGSLLYDRLLRILTMQGYRTAMSLIVEPNPPSRRLHERFGFRDVGLLRGIGEKHGHSLDLAMLQRPLCTDMSRPIIPYEDGLLAAAEAEIAAKKPI